VREDSEDAPSIPCYPADNSRSFKRDARQVKISWKSSLSAAVAQPTSS
jgi:hypothetical protein